MKIWIWSIILSGSKSNSATGSAVPKGGGSNFKIKDSDEELAVFTTRPDTLFGGATYMVISPEHPILTELRERITNLAQIEAYQKEAQKKTEFERSALSHDKTGGVRIEGGWPRLIRLIMKKSRSGFPITC